MTTSNELKKTNTGIVHVCLDQYENMPVYIFPSSNSLFMWVHYIWHEIQINYERVRRDKDFSSFFIFVALYPNSTSTLLK
jgi:hypothetical protein